MNGDEFVVRYTVEETVKATRRRVTVDEVGLYRVKDGKIAEERSSTRCDRRANKSDRSADLPVGPARFRSSSVERLRRRFRLLPLTLIARPVRPRGRRRRSRTSSSLPGSW